jgi:hypothetical protein
MRVRQIVRLQQGSAAAPAAPCGPRRAVAIVRPAAQLPSLTPPPRPSARRVCSRFCVAVLNRLVRLSYWERIHSVLPEDFRALLPPKPEVAALPPPDDADAAAADPEGAAAAAMLAVVRGKALPEELDAWVVQQVCVRGGGGGGGGRAAAAAKGMGRGGAAARAAGRCTQLQPRWPAQRRILPAHSLIQQDTRTSVLAPHPTRPPTTHTGPD